MDSRIILDRLYTDASLLGPQPKRSWLSRSRASSTTRFKVWHLLFGALAVTGWIVVHLHYYNLLVDLEFNTKASWAQVEAQLQRRYHIQKNIAKIVIDYSKYEKELLTNLTKMRTSAMGGNPMAKAMEANPPSPIKSPKPPPLPNVKQMTPPQLDKLFSDIMVVAEQYPQLKLTENFQQFSEAIIDTENKIAEQIMGYNKAVNDYTTVLKQFPGNIFGVLAGFKSYDFYTPDKEVLRFSPVEY